MKLEWKARWSGGMREAAVLIRDGAAIPQNKFARWVRHIPGGSELYRAEVGEEDTILFLYQSGSGRTESVEALSGPRKDQTWDSFDGAEQELGLPEESLWNAFLDR